jgi:hypothetical protein
MSGYKVRILAKNHADGLSGTGTPAIEAEYVARLGKATERKRMCQVHESSSAQQLVCDLATGNVAATVCALTRTRLVPADTVRARYMSAVGSPQLTVYDSTALAALDTTGIAGTVLASTDPEFDGYRNWFHYHARQTGIYNVVLDWAKSVDNTWEAWGATKLWLGEYFEFTYHVPFGGLDLTLKTGAKRARADDGTHHVTRNWSARDIRLDLRFITDADLPTVLELMTYLGEDRECLLDVFPESGNARGIWHRGAFRVADSPTFNPWQVGLHKNTITFEET